MYFRLKKETDCTTFKDARNSYRLKQDIDDTEVKDIRKCFRLKKENKAMRNQIIRYIRSIFEYEEDYYKPVTAGNFWSNSYIEYNSDGDRNKTLSVEEYCNKIKPYLKNVIKNLKKSDTWKIQLTIAINFISSKDNDEKCVMHSKRDNIEIMINDKAEEVIEKPFEILLNKYQIGLKTPMRCSDFIINCVHLLYYICHKINLKLGESYIDSPDQIKTIKQQQISSIKKDNKCFQYAVKVALNHEQIKKNLQRIKKLNLLQINRTGKEQITHRKRCSKKI